MGMDPDVINFDDLPTENAQPKQAAPQGLPDVIGFDDLPDEATAAAPRQAQPVAVQPEATGMLAGVGSGVVRSYQDTQVNSGIAEKFRLQGYKTALEQGGQIETDIGELVMSRKATPAQVDLLRRGVPKSDPVWRVAELARVTSEMANLDQSIKDSAATIQNYSGKSQPYQDLQAANQLAIKEGRPVMGTLENLWDNPAGIPEFVAEGAYGTAKPIVGAIASGIALRRGNAAPLAQTLGPIAVSMGITGVDSYKGQVAEMIEKKAQEGGINLRKNPEMMSGLLQDANFIEAVKSDALKAGINDAAWAGISTWLGMTPRIKGIWQPIVQSAAESATSISQDVVLGRDINAQNAIMSGVAGAVFEGPTYGIHSAFSNNAATPPAAPAAGQQQTTPPPAPAQPTATAPAAPDVIPFDDLPSVAGETVEPAAAEPAPTPAAPAPAPVQPQAEAPAAPAPTTQPQATGPDWSDAGFEARAAAWAERNRQQQEAAAQAPVEPVAQPAPVEPAATQPQPEPAPAQPQAATPVATENVEPRPKMPAKDAPRSELDAYWIASKEWDAKHSNTHWHDGTPKPARWIKGTPEYAAREAAEKARQEAEAAQQAQQAQPTPAAPVEQPAQPTTPAPVATQPEATPAPVSEPDATVQPSEKKQLPEPEGDEAKRVYQRQMASDVIDTIRIDGKSPVISELSLEDAQMLFDREVKKLMAFIGTNQEGSPGYASYLANVRRLKRRIDALKAGQSEATTAPAPQPAATAQPAAPAQTEIAGTDAEIKPPQSPQAEAFQPPAEKPKKPKKPAQTEADKLRKRIEKLESFGDEKSQAQADKLKATLAKMTGETTALAPAATPDTTAVEQKQQLYISIAGKNYPVGSLPEASEKWNQFRDGVQSMGLSVNVGRTPEAQRFARKVNRGDGPVVIDQNGNVVGYISPNGKIWKKKGSIEGGDLMYDPYAAEADRAKAAPKPVGMEGKPEPKTMEEFLEAKEIYEKAAKAYPEGSAMHEAYMWWAREYNGEYYSQKNRKKYDAEVAAAKLAEQKAKDSVIDVEATTEPAPAAEAAADQPKQEAKPASEAPPTQADLDGINDKLAEMERNKQGDSPEAEALRQKRDAVQSKLETAPARNIDAEYEAAVATKKIANIDPLVKEEATRQGFTIGPVYHGTPTGGFNKFDPNRTGSNAGVSRGGPSFTTNQEAAEAYAESMDPEERAIADLVAKANEIFATIPEDALGMVYDSTAVGDIRFDTKAVDSLESAVDSLGDYAEELRKAGYPEVAAKLEALAKEDFEGGKPEVKAVFLRLSGKPREITTTRAKMAEDLKGVRATADSPVVVNLEDGEKIYYIGNPKDIKSADAIARDDAGKVVPLSRRFQESDDLRGALDQAVVNAAEKAVPTEEGIIAALDKAAAERLRLNRLNTFGPDLVAAMIWQTARDIQKGVVSFAKWSADMAKKFPSLKGSLKAIWAKAQDVAKRPMDYIRFRALDSIADKVWQNAGRNPASATLRKIANIVFAKAGPDADATENDIPTRINLVRNQFSNIYANIMERFAAEFRDMTPEQRRKWDEDFRAAVIDGTTPSDPKVAQAVKDFRNLMRDMLAYQRNAGIEMGDQGANYFPRNYDADAVEANRDGFIAAAQEMYRKREERLLNKAIRDVRRAEQDRPAERRAADRKFGRKEKTDAEYRSEAAEWAQEKIAALEEEFNAKDDDYYKQKAEDWATAITHGDVLGLTLFKTSEGKVTSDSTDARTFTNEEAKLADEFLKKNIDDIMLGYIDGAVRGAEVGRIFGQDGSKFEQMMNQLSKEGVDAETVKETRRLVQKALGVGREQQSQATAAFFDWVNVVLAGAFLGKTFVYNLVLEPISFGIRTGNAYLALKSMADTWRYTIEELSTPSPATRQRIEAKYGSQAAFAKSVTETVAEQVGLIQNEMERAYFNSHWDYSSDEKGSKLAKWISQRIYRANLMSATEKAKVQASIGIARLALRDNARFFTGDAPIQKLFKALGFDTNADKSAAVIMRENGVPDADHKAFAAWVAGLEGKTDAEWQKAVMDPKDPMAKHYRRALQRMSLGMSIKTNPALKMEMSDSVLGRLMMQLMNYSYAYSNLVKDRMYSMAAKTVAKDASTIDRLRYAAPLLVGAPLAIMGAAASKALIAKLWPSDDEEKRSKETPMVRKAFNWASFAGMFGPKVEYLFKSFERGQAPGGPVGETIFRGGQAVFAAANDPDSEKKAYNAKKQLYNSTVKPVVTGAGAAVHPFFGFLGNAAVNTQAAREAVTGEAPRK